MTFRTNWYCSTDLDPVWELHESGWHLLVAGDAPPDVTTSFPVPPEHYAATTRGYTAHRVVNAVPCVVAGIRTTVDPPQIIAALGT